VSTREKVVKKLLENGCTNIISMLEYIVSNFFYMCVCVTKNFQFCVSS